MAAILKNALYEKISDLSTSNIDYKGTRYLHANFDAFNPFCRIQSKILD